ncbi:MAG: hypothetical protein BWY76_02505 [bacterium ADurb.Bin429]|nr:MAG: hypothetical protein BWY76_02505 [bacterium ADurb.Bin429]
MVLVCDKTAARGSFRRRPTRVVDKDCPCRPCYHPHDFGESDHTGNHYPDLRCATNCNHGCPTPNAGKVNALGHPILPYPTPEHVYSGRGRVCKRCGFRRPNQYA